MTSPGGQEVGRVSIRVVPDTSKFRDELKAKLEKATKGITVKVGIELDDQGLKTKVKGVVKDAEGEEVKVKIQGEDDGVVRETRRLRQLAQKLVGSIKLLVTVNIPESLAVIRGQMAIIDKAVKAYRINIPMEVVGLTKWLAILGSVSGIILGITHGMAALGGAVNVVGGALALLPALAAGAAAGIAALVVGLKGFFSALSASGDPAKFEEALQKLTPNAQDAARALVEFKKPLGEIRKAVQEELFSGMDDQFRKMKVLLPPIKEGLTGVAGGIRDMISSWIDMASSQRSVKDTGVILTNVRKGFEAMRPALANFGQAFKDITVVASGFLPQLGQSVTNISKKFADWAANARATGKMHEWISVAIAKIKQFFRVIKNVIDGLQNITKGLRAGAGEDFLDMFERLTDNFKDFTGTKEFQSDMESLGRVMSEVVDIASTVFKEVFIAIGKVFKDIEPFLLTFARALGGTIVGALKVITPMLQGMARWLSENRMIMAPLAVAVVALVTAFKLLATVAKGVMAVKKSVDTIRAAGGIMGEVGGKVIGAVKQMMLAMGRGAVAASQWAYSWALVARQAIVQSAKTAGAWIANTAKMVATATANFVKMAATAVANFVKMAAVATANAIKTAAVWIVQTTIMVARVLAQMAIAVAAWVANWVRMAAVATANAIRMAAAWLIAMGPIGLVIAAIVALVALIIMNWDTIWAWTTKIFGAIWDFIVMIFTNVWNFITGLWDSIVEFFGNIPGWIGSALSTVWDVITYPFRQAWDIVTDLWDAIGEWFGRIPKWIQDALSNVWDVLTWPFRKAWEFIEGIIDGIKDAISAVGDFITGLFSDSGEWEAGMTVPVTFMSDKSSLPKLSTGFEPFSFEEFADFGNLEALSNGLVASAHRASLGLSQDISVATPDSSESIADQIERALSNWSVEIDGNGIAKLVNKANLKNRRRG